MLTTTATINHVESKLTTVNIDSNNLHQKKTVSTQTADNQRDSQAKLASFKTTSLSVILEYASPLWHPTLTKSQTELLEAVQRRALKIIFCYSSSTSYLTTLELVGILSLQTRRVDLSKRFFRNICKPDNCLRHLFPPPRDLSVTSHLRKPTVYPRPSLRTKRYCSAVSCALLNFQ